MRVILVLIFGLVWTSCSSSSKDPNVLDEPVEVVPVRTEAPKNYKKGNVVQLTQEGENVEGYFSPDGQRVLYRSAKRTQHRDGQIYELTISTMKERRITYHDGEATCAYYYPKGSKFFYASTTDEIKEDKQLVQKASVTPLSPSEMMEHESLPPLEIYMSNLDGSEITRLTHSEGYDSEVSVHPSGQSLVFTSIRSGNLELFTLDLKTKGIRKITQNPGADGGAFYSPNGKFLTWRRFNPEMTVSHIMLANSLGADSKALTTKKAIHWSPSWHPNGVVIVFSSNRDEAQNFELYTVDLKGLCLKRLTYESGLDSNPTFSPDGTKILFTSNRTGRSQLYLMDYNPPESCANELP